MTRLTSRSHIMSYMGLTFLAFYPLKFYTILYLFGSLMKYAGFKKTGLMGRKNFVGFEMIGGGLTACRGIGMELGWMWLGSLG